MGIGLIIPATERHFLPARRFVFVALPPSWPGANLPRPKPEGESVKTPRCQDRLPAEALLLISRSHMKTLSRLSARFSHPPEPRDETFSKRGLPPGRLLADENANSAESTSAAASVSSGQHSWVRRQCRPSAYLASASRGAHSLDPEGLCSSLSDQREMVTRCPPASASSREPSTTDRRS